MRKNVLLALFFFVFISSCKDKASEQTQVYNNDFESNNLSQITNGQIEQFNGTAVLGRYNNGNFTLKLDNLPAHDLITISLDLYIHDSWDGNKQDVDGPDIWQLLVDGGLYVNTTFSNTTCGVNEFCSPQSYPLDYPNNYNNPKTGAYRINLPAACKPTEPRGTSVYKIVKTISHSNSTLLLQCLDKLVQPNAPDPKCDESWSIDNLNIKAIKL
ncbi:hypothetical protein ACFQZS_11770 [Mucilaginibacter calamicampi]|uniref:Lipoprotein n=1 Tax=Mucilaginibacter calamicampi TaxID=1302352 RepID=A0ABW2YZG0_9SPHI